MTTIDSDYFEEELRIQYLHEQLMELITDDYWKKFENFFNSYKIGELYVFKDDTVFYRVMIEKIWSTSPDFQIFSVDFGWRKICQSKDLIPLPPEPFIIEYPARMAMRISLGMRKLTSVKKGCIKSGKTPKFGLGPFAKLILSSQSKYYHFSIDLYL